MQFGQSMRRPTEALAWPARLAWGSMALSPVQFCIAGSSDLRMARSSLGVDREMVGRYWIFMVVISESTGSVVGFVKA
jgi:hypothetical protein